MITSGTIKVTFPSNYADNRRGAEVSLSYALEENAEWATAEAVTSQVSALAVKTGLAIVAGEYDKTSATIAPTTAPDAPSPKHRKNPADVVIGGGVSTTAPAPTETSIGAVVVSADASAPSPAAGAANVFPMPGAATGPQPVQPAIAPSTLVPGLVMPGESVVPLPVPVAVVAVSPSAVVASAVAGGEPSYLASVQALIKWAQGKVPAIEEKIGSGRGAGKLLSIIAQVTNLPPEQRQQATIGYLFNQGKAAEFVAAVEALLAA